MTPLYDFMLFGFSVSFVIFIFFMAFGFSLQKSLLAFTCVAGCFAIVIGMIYGIMFIVVHVDASMGVSISIILISLTIPVIGLTKLAHKYL